MLRKLNLFLAMLAVIITIFPLAQARGRDGHRHGKDTKAKQHQIKKGKGKLHSQLTAEQREAIKSKVSQMKEAEATSKEIKQTVDQMMLDFGVNPAQRKDKGRRKGRNPFDQLTEEQKSQVEAKVKEIREAGADRREIRKQMATMLEEFGIDPAQRKDKGRGKGRNPFDQLTNEQKSQIEAKVKEIREAGADRRQIRKQMATMLEEFGLEAPQKKKGGKRGGFRGKGKRRYTTP